MTKLEYDEKYKLIKSLRDSIKTLKLEVSKKGEGIPQLINNFLESATLRDTSFDKYTSSLSKFHFDQGSELTPLNQFPGIVVNNKIIDPEVLNQQSEEMKKEAFTVKNEAKKVEAYKQRSLQDLKRLLNALIEYSLQSDQIYELELDLLQDLDSEYDVGQLKSTSVNG